MGRLERFCWNSEAQGGKKATFFLENVLRLHEVLLPSNYYQEVDCYAITARRVSKLKILAFKSPGDIGSSEENAMYTPG